MMLIEFDPETETSELKTELSIHFLNKYEIKVYREYDCNSAPLILLYYASSNNIERNWLQIVNDFGLYFQSKITKEFIRRNITIFFMSDETLPFELKEAIQNDVYACRKVVFENVNEPIEKLNSYYLYGYETNINHLNESNLGSIIKEVCVSVYSELDNENR